MNEKAGPHVSGVWIMKDGRAEKFIPGATLFEYYVGQALTGAAGQMDPALLAKAAVAIATAVMNELALMEEHPPK